MNFLDLCTTNKDWHDLTSLIVISNESHQAHTMDVRTARSFFGNRKVFWFKDCVVMLF